MRPPCVCGNSTAAARAPGQHAMTGTAAGQQRRQRRPQRRRQRAHRPPWRRLAHGRERARHACTPPALSLQGREARGPAAQRTRHGLPRVAEGGGRGCHARRPTSALPGRTWSKRPASAGSSHWSEPQQCEDPHHRASGRQHHPVAPCPAPAGAPGTRNTASGPRCARAAAAHAPKPASAAAMSGRASRRPSRRAAASRAPPGAPSSAQQRATRPAASGAHAPGLQHRHALGTAHVH